MPKMTTAERDRYTRWTQATIDAIRERADKLALDYPDAARKLRDAADAIDAAWEIVDE